MGTSRSNRPSPCIDVDRVMAIAAKVDSDCVNSTLPPQLGTSGGQQLHSFEARVSLTSGIRRRRHCRTSGLLAPARPRIWLSIFRRPSRQKSSQA
ncbi:hypothetical protein KC339_g82 [Hortaea werneckii]|nr:hypothetical protein KC339_g82 [Hortaea werneckii]